MRQHESSLVPYDLRFCGVTWGSIYQTHKCGVCGFESHPGYLTSADTVSYHVGTP